MTDGKLRIFTLIILLQFIVSKSQVADQPECVVSATIEVESCIERDVTVKDSENDDKPYRRKDHIQQQQSWLSSLYNSVTKTLSDVTTSIVQRYFESGSTDAAQYSADIQSEEMSSEQLMKTASAMLNQFFDIDLSKEKMMKDMLKEAFSKNEEKVTGDDTDYYEYPPVHRINPGKVGNVQYVEIMEGVKAKLITRAVRPPLFEIPDFMPSEDCDYIIEKSQEKGLKVSKLFKSKEDTDAGKNIGTHRESFSSSLKLVDVDEAFLSRLHDKLAVLIGMPKRVVQWSEHLSIGMYEQGGHYHAHVDSNEVGIENPCCFQKKCLNSKGEESDNKDCCRLCRYVTVLYYLNDVEEGGETAFPLADLSIQEMLETGKNESWKNLTSHCHDASVVIKPKKGKAIMWYNHFVDGKGYITAVDKRSYHGGCEVTKGPKWIATNWISTPIYPHRYKPSKYRDII